MDEPSASLDKESIERLVIMAEDLLQRGASLVITSHQTNALTDLWAGAVVDQRQHFD